MQEPDVLQRIGERAGALVAQNLRSASVVLSHLRELIVEAHDIGHSHKAIHASLAAAGLRASWNTYKSCLARMKKATRAVPSSSSPSSSSFSSTATATATATATVTATSARSPDASMRPGAAVADEATPLQSDLAPTYPSASATRVLDALIEARKVASRDYAQIARDLHRQQQREPSRKDRP